jgi:hypothetical protein
LDASGFSDAIAEKSRVKDDVEMLGTLPEPPPLEAELLEEGELLPPPLLLQAARATPAVTASADVQLILVIKFKGSPQVSAGTADGRCASMRSSVQETAAASAFDGNLKPVRINGALTSPSRHKNSVNKTVRRPLKTAPGQAKQLYVTVRRTGRRIATPTVIQPLSGRYSGAKR